MTHNTKPPRPDKTENRDRQTDRAWGEALLQFALLLPSSPTLKGPLYSSPISQPLIQFLSLTAKKQQNQIKRTKPPPRHTLRILLHPLPWPRGKILTPKKVLQLLPPGGAETEQELGLFISL